jgi:hypothetical protein
VAAGHVTRDGIDRACIAIGNGITAGDTFASLDEIGTFTRGALNILLGSSAAEAVGNGITAGHTLASLGDVRGFTRGTLNI